MEQKFIEAITSFGIGGLIFRVLGMLIFGGISGLFSRKVFIDNPSFKDSFLYALISLACFGIAYLIAIPFFKHPMTDIGTSAMYIIVISWIFGLWDKRVFDF